MLTASLPLFIYSYNAFKHCINMYKYKHTHTARNDKLETIYFRTFIHRHMPKRKYISLRLSKSDNICNKIGQLTIVCE